MEKKSGIVKNYDLSNEEILKRTFLHGSTIRGETALLIGGSICTFLELGSTYQNILTIGLCLTVIFTILLFKYSRYQLYVEEKKLYSRFTKTLGTYIDNESIRWVLSEVSEFLVKFEYEKKVVESFLYVSPDLPNYLDMHLEPLLELYKYFYKLSHIYSYESSWRDSYDLRILYLSKLKLVIGLKRLGIDLSSVDEESAVLSILNELNYMGDDTSKIFGPLNPYSNSGLAGILFTMKKESIEEDIDSIEKLFLKAFYKMLAEEEHSDEVRIKIMGFINILNKYIGIGGVVNRIADNNDFEIEVNDGESESDDNSKLNLKS